VVRLNRPSAEDDGAIAIIVAIFAIMMATLAALVVSVGSADEARRSAQNAADTAALAAAAAFYEDPPPADRKERAGQVAEAYAKKNFPANQPAGNYWQGCTAPIEANWEIWLKTTGSSVPCVAFYRDPSPADPAHPYTMVQVAVPGLKTFSFLGAVSGTVRAIARAKIPSFSGGITPADCLLCIASDYDGGNGTVSVINGSAVVGGAITLNNNGVLTVTGGTVQSGQPWTGPGTVTPTPTPGSFSDPFPQSVLPLPPPPPAAGAFQAPFGTACHPGNWKDNLAGCLTFEPGIYVIAGNGSSPATVLPDGATLDNVLLYFTCISAGGSAPAACGSGEQGARFGGVPNNGVASIVGLSNDPTYGGFAMIFDRNNASAHDLTGKGTLDVTGNIYSVTPAGTFDLGQASGNATVSGTVVLGKVTISGGANQQVLTVTSPVLPLPQPTAGIPNLVR
jgi:hypothetical protein